MARREFSHAGKTVGADVDVSTDYDSLVIKSGASTVKYSAPTTGYTGIRFIGAATEQCIIASNISSTLTFSTAYYFRVNSISASNAQIINPRTASAKTGSHLFTTAAVNTFRNGNDTNVLAGVTLATGVIYLARFSQTIATTTTGKTQGTITRVSDSVVVYDATGANDSEVANNGTAAVTTIRFGKLDAASAIDFEIWGEATDTTYALINPTPGVTSVGTISEGTASIQVGANVPITDSSTGTSVVTVAANQPVAVAESSSGTSVVTVVANQAVAVAESSSGTSVITNMPSVPVTYTQGSSGTAAVSVSQRPSFPVPVGSTGTASLSVVQSAPVTVATSSSGTAGITAEGSTPSSATTSSSGTAVVVVTPAAAINAATSSSGTAATQVQANVAAATSSSGTVGITVSVSVARTAATSSSGTGVATVAPAPTVPVVTSSTGTSSIVAINGNSLGINTSGTGTASATVVPSTAITAATSSSGTATIPVAPAVNVTIPDTTTTVVADTFTRANSTTVGSAETGQAWSGLLGVDAGQAYVPTGLGLAFLEVGQSDQAVAAGIYLNGVSSAFVGVVARYLDSGNFYYADLSASGGVFTWRLMKFNAAVSVQLGSGTVPALAGGERLGLRVVGSRITATLDDVVLLGVTDSSVATGTKAGVRLAGSGSDVIRWDNFRADTYATPSSGTSVATAVPVHTMFVPTNSTGNKAVTLAHQVAVAASTSSSGTAVALASNGQPVTATTGSQGTAAVQVTASQPRDAVTSGAGALDVTAAASMPAVASVGSTGSVSITAGQGVGVPAGTASSGSVSITVRPAQEVQSAHTSSGGTAAVILDTGIQMFADTTADGEVTVTVNQGALVTAQKTGGGSLFIQVEGEVSDYYPGRHTAEGPLVSRDKGGSMFIRRTERFQVFWFLTPAEELEEGWEVKIGDSAWIPLEVSTALDGSPGLRVIIQGPDAPADDNGQPFESQAEVVVVQPGAYATTLRMVDETDVEVIATDELIVI